MKTMLSTMAIIASLSISSCSEDENYVTLEKKFMISEIKLDVSYELILEAGKDTAVTATIYPENASNPAIKWQSMDENIAKVSADGIITAMKAGKTSIVVSPQEVSSISSVIQLEVVDKIIYPNEMNITPGCVEVFAGESMSLELTTVPTEITYKEYFHFVWESENESIAKVSDKGVVTGVSKGTTKITVRPITGGNVAATVEVKVKDAVIATNISFEGEAPELGLNETQKLNFKITPENATLATVNWESSKTDIITIEDGRVTAKGFGTATITASTGNGNSATIDVNVVKGKLFYMYSEKWNNLELATNGDVALTPGVDALTITCKPDWGNYFCSTNVMKGQISEKWEGQEIRDYFAPATYQIVAIKVDASTAGLQIDIDPHCLKAGDSNRITGSKTFNNEIKVKDLNESPNLSTIVKYVELKDVCGGKIKEESLVGLTNFYLKFWLKGQSHGNCFKLYWLRSFKSVDELNEYLESQGDIDETY